MMYVRIGTRIVNLAMVSSIEKIYDSQDELGRVVYQVQYLGGICYTYTTMDKDDIERIDHLIDSLVKHGLVLLADAIRGINWSGIQD